MGLGTYPHICPVRRMHHALPSGQVCPNYLCPAAGAHSSLLHANGAARCPVEIPGTVLLPRKVFLSVIYCALHSLSWRSSYISVVSVGIKIINAQWKYTIDMFWKWISWRSKTWSTAVLLRLYFIRHFLIVDSWAFILNADLFLKAPVCFIIAFCFICRNFTAIPY